MKLSTFFYYEIDNIFIGNKDVAKGRRPTYTNMRTPYKHDVQ